MQKYTCNEGVLFKVFADIDVFDIEIDATDVDHFVSTVKAILQHLEELT